MTVTTFPDDCRALIVEPEPVQAMALDLMLEELGWRSLGPAGSLTQVIAVCS
jgi:hypothetical protein